MDYKDKKIIVLGAGFAGFQCAKFLNRFFPGQITLIDKNDYHLYTPLLYELDEGKVKLPIKTSAKFIQKEVSDFHELDYDYLVLATGAEVNYYNIPGLKESAITFKNLEDIKKLQKVPAGEILIIGGGFTGCELAMELAIKLTGERLKIVDASTCILPNLDEELRKKAERRLRKWGVEIFCGYKLTKVENQQVFFENGKVFKFDNLVWTGGVRLGRHKVDEFLRVKEEKNVFAIGDCASTSPGLIRPALNQAKIAAENIKRSIEGKALAAYKPKVWAVVVPLGGYYAVAKIGKIKIAGFIAWFIKEIINFWYTKNYSR
ncbi:MAG: FAD-dependent oxidoreductase [Candidatus Nealsonbacteria bacterium]|nr:FAD-dependent oxidoreductase [Candidatus Nealsonbacteria bacterium]